MNQDSVFLSFVGMGTVPGARAIYSSPRGGLYVVRREREAASSLLPETDEGYDAAYEEVCRTFAGCLGPAESLSLWTTLGQGRERCVWAAGGESEQALVGLTAWDDWSQKSGGAPMVVREVSGVGHIVLASAVDKGAEDGRRTLDHGWMPALVAALGRERASRWQRATDRKHLALMRLNCADAWLLDLRTHSRLTLQLGGDVQEVPWQCPVAPHDAALFRREIDALINGSKKRSVINLRYGAGYKWHEMAARVVQYDDAGVPTQVAAVLHSIDERYRAEEEMRRSEELRDRILDQVPATIIFADTQGRIEFVNESGLRQLGLRAQSDLIGVNFLDDPSLTESLRAQIRGSEVCCFDLTYDFDLSRRMGHYNPLKQGTAEHSVRISHLRSGGEDKGYMVVCTDVSQNVVQKRRERLLLSFFDEVGRHTKIGVCELGPEGFASEQWNANLVREQGTGIKEQGTGNKEQGAVAEFDAWGTSLSEEERAELDEIVSQMRAGKMETYEGNIEIGQADGPHTIRLQLMRGPRGGITALSTDVTADEQRNETLTRALRKAEQLESLRGQFLNNVSHEMRTPLNAIIGFSDLIAARVGGEMAQYADIVRSNNHRLLRVMDGVMELSSIQSGEKRVNLAEIPLSSVMKVVARRTADLGKPGVRYIESLPAEFQETVVCTDPLIVAQIVEHLVGNALEHTYDGEVNTWIDCQGDDFVVHVTDTGCGIPREKQEVVFDPFVKLDNFSQGAGLGLALCRGYSELLGAQLTVVSTPGVGSHFKLTAPRERLVAELPPQRCAVVLSDDSSLGVHVSLMLPEFDVVSCTSDDFSRAVLEKKPELIVLDARCCPEAAAQYVGNARRGDGGRRILVLNGPQTKLADDALRGEGADAVLTAPIAVVELWRSIKGLVRAVSPRPSSWEHIA